MNAPAGPVAGSIAPVYWILFFFAIVVLVIVDGALIFAGIKFRERPGVSAKQFHGHNMLELTWTVIPTLMVLSFSLISFQRLLYINDVSTNAEMTINVVAQQWTWNFTYPNEAAFQLNDGTPLTDAETLNIPANTKVRLELSSKDVIHSFWVPLIGGKKDAVPGRSTELWIQADQPGTYKGQCFEFCGRGHADMLITLVVHSKQDYAQWQKDAVAKANLFNDPATKTGKELFRTLACSGCHTIKGLTKATVGPELTHIASKANIAGVLTPVNEENLKKWINDPKANKPGTLMPTLGLPADQIDAIVKFLLTQK